MTFLLLLIFSNMSLAATTLVMEPSERSVFQGESFTTTFRMESDAESLDIEVEKFPSFTGYWSDSLTLRQGPMALDNAGSAVVGMYRLTPSMFETERTMNAMQLRVREIRGGIRGDEFLLRSEMIPIEVKPLPKISDVLSLWPFVNLVGFVQVRADSTEVSYFKDQPVYFRWMVSGSGSVDDFSLPTLQLPQGVAVIDHSVQVLGRSDPWVLRMEYILTSNIDEDWVVPEQAFLAFDPRHENYYPVTVPQIAAKKQILEIVKDLPGIEFSRADELLTWHTKSNSFFLIVIFLVNTVGLSLVIYFLRQKKSKRIHSEISDMSEIFTRLREIAALPKINISSVERELWQLLDRLEKKSDDFDLNHAVQNLRNILQKSFDGTSTLSHSDILKGTHLLLAKTCV